MHGDGCLGEWRRTLVGKGQNSRKPGSRYSPIKPGKKNWPGRVAVMGVLASQPRLGTSVARIQASGLWRPMGGRLSTARIVPWASTATTVSCRYSIVSSVGVCTNEPKKIWFVIVAASTVYSGCVAMGTGSRRRKKGRKMSKTRNKHRSRAWNGDDKYAGFHDADEAASRVRSRLFLREGI